MKFLPLKVSCPVCGSQNITYTCEPKCCFNHICDSCYATFQLLTETVGGVGRNRYSNRGKRSACTYYGMRKVRELGCVYARRWYITRWQACMCLMLFSLDASHWFHRL